MATDWHSPTIRIDGALLTGTTLPKPITSLVVERSVDRAIHKVPMRDGVDTQGDSEAAFIINVTGEIHQSVLADTVMPLIDGINSILDGDPLNDNEFRFFSYYNPVGYNRWYEKCVLQSFSWEPMTEIEARPWLRTAYNISIIAKDPTVYTDSSYAGGTGTYPTPQSPTYTTTCVVNGPLVIKGGLAIRNNTSGLLVTRLSSTGSIYFTGDFVNTATLS